MVNMKNNKLLADFIQAIEDNKAEIINLQIEYKLKEIQNKIVQAKFKDARDKVLNNNEFYATTEMNRWGIKKGDRITDSKYDWLLGKEDFDRYQALCTPIFVEENLTDEKGYYTEETNTERQLTQLKDKLIKLSVNILPNDFPKKNLLIDAINFKSYDSYNTRERLFELVMKI
jgi:hypothetical protein